MSRKFGGVPEDYLEINNFIDSSGMAHSDVRHRAMFHSSFGCFICEKVFGVNITNSDGKLVSVRDIAEEHIMQDLGFIPSVSHYLNNMSLEPWMSGTEKFDRKKLKEILL